MAQTLGQAYKGYGAARRDALEGQRRFETINKGLEAGAELSFAASSQLEAAEKTSQEFKTAEKMLGDDVQQIDLETGEAWKERSILGRGDSVSYLNPFEWGGERGLRVGETLYSEADVSGISKDKDFYNIKAGDEKGLATYRENLQSVYGTDAKDTDWWKKEQADIKTKEEEQGHWLEQAAAKAASSRRDIKEDKDIAAYKQGQIESDEKRLAALKRDRDIRIEAAGAEAEYDIRERTKKERIEEQRLKDWAKSNPRVDPGRIDEEKRLKKLKLAEEESLIQKEIGTKINPLKDMYKQLQERDYFTPKGMSEDVEGTAIWEDLLEQINLGKNPVKKSMEEWQKDLYK